MVRRIAKWVSLGGIGLLIVGGIGAWLWFSAFLYGWFIPKQSPDQLAALMKSGWVFDQGDPARCAADTSICRGQTVVFAHGCGGMDEDKFGPWADGLTVQEPYLMIDSMGPRGLSGRDGVDAVCGGKALLGGERAGDVAVGLDWARKNSAQNDMFWLVGHSHGGWSVMDFLAGVSQDTLPSSLNAWPESFEQNELNDIVGIVLLQPYCGLGNWTKATGWATDAPVLFVLGGEDGVISNDECREQAHKLDQSGSNVEIWEYPGVGHNFHLEGFEEFSTPQNAIAREAFSLRLAGWTDIVYRSHVGLSE